jgi:hypothetical protein
VIDMRTMLRFGGALAVVVLAAGAVLGQQAEPMKQAVKPSDKPSDKPSEKASEKPAGKPPARAEPTLDELLGLSKKPAASGKAEEGKNAEGESGDAASTPQSTPKDSARAALDRQLASDQPVSDELVQAIALMRESEERLKASDAGAQTQRVQDETLKLLDKLIAQAKQNQQKQKQQQSQQQQGQKQQSSERQQQQKQSSQQQGQQQGQAQAQQQGTGDGRGGNPASAQAQTRQLPQGAQAAWGNLPPHVRDALMQGASDAYSSTWEQLTGEYYKRLAEQDAAKSRSKP